MTDQNPWLALTSQAREIAVLAERYASSPPADLAPGEGGDPLVELDTRALELRGTVAACRRHTWRQLHDGGMSYAAIGRLWGKTLSAVRNALVAPDRAR